MYREHIRYTVNSEEHGYRSLLHGGWCHNVLVYIYTCKTSEVYEKKTSI